MDDDTVRIWRYWWKDDFETGTRYLRSESHTQALVSPTDIATALSLGLDDILAWEVTSLLPRTGMKDVWHSAFDEESFVAQEQRYPSPRLP